MRQALFLLGLALAAGTSSTLASTHPGGDGGGPRLGECVCGEEFGTADPTCFINDTCDAKDACDGQNECPEGFFPLQDNCCDPPLRDCLCVPVCEKDCSTPGTFSGGDCDPLFPLCHPIPAVSEWGLGLMVLSVLIAATILLRRRRRVAQG